MYNIIPNTHISLIETKKEKKTQTGIEKTTNNTFEQVDFKD